MPKESQLRHPSAAWMVLVTLIAICSFAGVPARADEKQAITLQGGWNLITFQVLPSTAHTPEAVLGAVIAADGTARPLYATNMPNNPLISMYHVRKSQSGIVLEKFPISASDKPPLPEGPQFADAASTQPLTTVDFGEAYFVNVQGIASDAAYSLTGQSAPISWRLTLDTGWNLVGIAGTVPLRDITTNGEGKDQPLNILSIFRASDLQKIVSIARWDAKNQRYQNYDPREPERAEFQVLDTGLGYWVQTSEALSLAPDMVVEAQSDEDNPPLANPPVKVGMPWNPGPEDLSISIPGQQAVFHDRSTQTIIRISKAENSVHLPLYNRGGGVLLWKATLLPYTGASPPNVYPLNTEESLRASIELIRSNANSVPNIQVQGVTSSEPDGIQIVIRRRNLRPGTYLAKLAIVSNSADRESGQQQKREFTIVIDVCGMQGSWKGSANILTVNGKMARVPDIDLVLQLYEDNVPGSHLLRGIIDSREALLWPVDADLLGHMAESPGGGYSAQYAGRFVISGGYTLPPGDVNRFPYGSFPSADAADLQNDTETGLQYATNSEGDRFFVGLVDRARLDENGAVREVLPNFTNPIPRFVSREVELDGEVAAPEQQDPKSEFQTPEQEPVVVGKYFETIRGLMRDPVQLEGTFRLVRQTTAAFARRPVKAFYIAPASGRPITHKQPFGLGSEESVNVNQHVLINRILVVVSQDMPDVKHTATLSGPNGKKIILHAREKVGPATRVIFDSGDIPIDPVTLLNPPEFDAASPALGHQPNDDRREAELRATLGQYVIRRPRESLLGAFQDTDAFGQWKLAITTNAGESGNVLGWGLLIYGAPIYTVEGDVIVNGNNEPGRFDDVQVRVTGLNADLAPAFTKFDRSTGHFSIGYLPGIRVDITATKPGFPTAHIDNLNLPGDPRGYRDNLFGIQPGQSILRHPPSPTTNFRLTLKQE